MCVNHSVLCDTVDWVFLGYRWYLPTVEYQLDLKGTNLLDEVVRYHTSFVKNTVPQPGRGFQLAFAAQF